MLHSILETFHRSFALLGSTPIGYSVGILGLCVLAIFASVMRWQILLRGLGIQVRLRLLLEINLAATCVGNLAPGRLSGDLLRVVLLQKRADIGLRLATASSLYDRAIEAAQFPLFVLLALPALPPLFDRLFAWHLSLTVSWPTVRSTLPWLVALGLLLLGLCIPTQRIVGLHSRLRQVLTELRTLRVPFRSLGISVLYAQAVWTLDALRLLVAARALGVVLTPWQAVALSISTLIECIVPTMGGLGAVEGTLITVLCVYGVSPERAMAITMLDRTISYGLVTVLSVVFVAFHRTRRDSPQ